MSLVRNFLLAAITGATATAAADPPTFQITSLFSSLDGSVQYIRLTETAGLDGQHRFAGLRIRSIAHGVVKEFTFAADLPTEKTAHATVVIASGGPILGGVAENDGSFFSTGDYFMPPLFLSSDGGVVEFAGVDQVTHGALPTDGIRGSLRDGTTAVVTYPYGVCRATARCWREGSVEVTSVTAWEYYNETLDRYLITASAADFAALDSGRHRGWQRTGFRFDIGAGPLVADYCRQHWDGCGGAYVVAHLETHALCRFYLPPEYGDSHLLAARDECAAVGARFPDFVLETEAAFFVVLPDPGTGECPIPNGLRLVSVFRLWNANADGSHRYTRNLFLRNVLIEQGWVPEGFGPMGVAFCVP